ncbi:hypothetical protein SERLA73DRAFT_148950 [Serpula lacrymans var. lacrymans S7.3]|uniref:Uncharacterized protein n=2 Tax=Serpula lacrymans var. lacrymans TaxID=341189 RepID=F8PH03_SERL3|nr:uncharacterized protein SERLADRAFT_431852 [Serpula lacrymans var. lacrymans S7.9]EGO04440.1 hypothetical protein SERLA73DRAFT_148950 [Serpula lacrymans var. lacrymans S7.3]EGO30332.1 hypothetical protein SERLADRAFT_431852 [Serpula lacrymans var. lacrymans S7.9]
MEIREVPDMLADELRLMDEDPEDVVDDYYDCLYDLIPTESEKNMAGPSKLPDENDEECIEVPHPPAGKVIRMDKTVYERWRREFGAEDMDGDMDMDSDMSDGSGNIFAPFASELDWRVACWAIQDGIGHISFDTLMTIPGVTDKLGLSYHNIYGLHKLVDCVPEYATWKTRELWFRNSPQHKHMVYHRDFIEAIKSLLGNPAHAKVIVYRPKRIFTNASKSHRIYNEMWARDWWNTAQAGGMNLNVSPLHMIVGMKPHLGHLSHDHLEVSRKMTSSAE